MSSIRHGLSSKIRSDPVTGEKKPEFKYMEALTMYLERANSKIHSDFVENREEVFQPLFYGAFRANNMILKRRIKVSIRRNYN